MTARAIDLHICYALETGEFIPLPTLTQINAPRRPTG